MNVACSFCGKGSADVRHLVGGDEVLICDECLDLCDGILAERERPESTTVTLRPVYSETTIRERISLAREAVTRGSARRFVVLFGDGEATAAAELLERVRLALGDVGIFRQVDVELSGGALVGVALPRAERPGSTQLN